MDATDIAVRLPLATLVGLLLGIDRELRGISAGIRTHALVAMSSATITISALILFHELNGLASSKPRPAARHSRTRPGHRLRRRGRDLRFEGRCP